MNYSPEFYTAAQQLIDAGRFIDQRGGVPATRAIFRGREKDITLGINWYMNDYLRFMANDIFVSAQLNGDGFHDNPEVFTLRAQIEF